MNAPSTVRVLKLEGSPRERGHIHGETLRSKILAYIGGWKNTLGESTGMDPDLYIEQLLAETDFVSAVIQWTPDLLEEVQGIAEGSGLDWKTMFAHQLGDEEWWYRRWKKLGISSQGNEHCSALGAFGKQDIPPLLAQNWDLPEYYDGYQVLLHIKHQDSALESFVVTVAGIVAANGLNNQSVGVCCNTLLQLDHAADGLPVDFVVRGILAQHTLKDAAAFVRQIKHASGQNYMIGGPEEILDFECSANQVREYAPYPGVGRIYHTNHPLVNDDQEMFMSARGKLSPEEKEGLDKGQADTRARFDFLAAQLKDTSEAITVERVKAILSSHEVPVCRDRGKGTGMTTGCLIMALSAPPVLNFAPGPPCSTPFEQFTF